MDTQEKLKALETEDQERRIRERLNRDKVKLWEPPHTNEDGSKGKTPNELVDRYSTDLEMDAETVLAVFERLRTHAVEKLATLKKFQKTGIATLKVKLAGCIPEKAKEFSKNPGASIEIDIKLNGLDLKGVICEHTEVDVVRLKIISRGRIIDDDQTLQQQGLKNQSLVMALCLTDSEVAARKKQDTAARVVKTREAAHLLSNKEDDGDSMYLHIADQTGKKLHIPPDEHKALVFAMTLHEKARGAMCRQDYGEALLLLLDADTEFKRCNSKLLSSVDNYALVCLDIVWCYLNLKSLGDLPDAEQRLVTCDECLRKTFGANLERLLLVKGETGIERALFMRLHLLQAILAFHQGQHVQAKSLLDRVEREMSELRVDDSSMTAVMAMGFSPQEARLALRACGGNVTMAISHIIKKQEDRRQRVEKEAAEKKARKIQNKLGKTANGSKVNVETYNALLEMGFKKGASAEALRQSNNNITLALQVLQENPALLDLPDPTKAAVPITDLLISQVAMMGFTDSAARLALTTFNGDVQRAVEELLKYGGEAPQDWKQSFSASSRSSGEGTSTGSSSEGSTPGDRELEKLAYDEIASDIAQDEEAHLDFTMEAETEFLNEYRALLNCIK